MSADQFRLSITKTPSSRTVTKRNLVSDVAKVYDALGLFSPIIVKMKIALQRLWELKLDWDDQHLTTSLKSGRNGGKNCLLSPQCASLAVIHLSDSTRRLCSYTDLAMRPRTRTQELCIFVSLTPLEEYIPLSSCPRHELRPSSASPSRDWSCAALSF